MGFEPHPGTLRPFFVVCLSCPASLSFRAKADGGQVGNVGFLFILKFLFFFPIFGGHIQ